MKGCSTMLPENSMQSPAMHFFSSAADPEAAPSTDEHPPVVPFELAESILLHVALRFPLRQTRNYRSADGKGDGSREFSAKMHNQCVAALSVVAPSPTMLKVLVPRLPRGPELILAHPSRFGAGFLQQLHRRGFRFPLAPAFAAAMQHNRADVLSWWVDKKTKLAVPSTWHDYADWDHTPVNLALGAKAWDALDWLANNAAACRPVCANAVGGEELEELVRTGGEREVQFVARWLKGSSDLMGYLGHVLEAACHVGAIEVLQAWADGGHNVGIAFDVRSTDAMARAAVLGRGPAVPVLEWMRSRLFRMPSVTKYAREAENQQVLAWCEENEARADFGIGAL